MSPCWIEVGGSVASCGDVFTRGAIESASPPGSAHFPKSLIPKAAVRHRDPAASALRPSGTGSTLIMAEPPPQTNTRRKIHVIRKSRIRRLEHPDLEVADLVCGHQGNGLRPQDARDAEVSAIQQRLKQDQVIRRSGTEAASDIISNGAHLGVASTCEISTAPGSEISSNQRFLPRAAPEQTMKRPPPALWSTCPQPNRLATRR